jgi:hypothetical protein
LDSFSIWPHRRRSPWSFEKILAMGWSIRILTQKREGGQPRVAAYRCQPDLSLSFDDSDVTAIPKKGAFLTFHEQSLSLWTRENIGDFAFRESLSYKNPHKQRPDRIAVTFSRREPTCFKSIYIKYLEAIAVILLSISDSNRF